MAFPAGRDCSRRPASTSPTPSCDHLEARVPRRRAAAASTCTHDYGRARTPTRRSDWRASPTSRPLPAAAQLACRAGGQRTKTRECVARAGRSRTCATRTSWPAPTRSARRWRARARPLGDTIRHRRRGNRALDPRQYQPRHRPAAGAAGSGPRSRLAGYPGGPSRSRRTPAESAGRGRPCPRGDDR